MKKRLLIGFIVCCVLGAVIVALTFFHKQYEENLRVQEEQRQEEQRQDVLRQKQERHEQLQGNITKLIHQDTGGTTYSVYADLLDGSGPILVNPIKMRATSMIKVFILAKSLEDEQDGVINGNQVVTLQEGMKVGGDGVLHDRADGTPVTVSELQKLMITENDNTAANILIDLIGMDRINEYLQREGYADTALQRKFMDGAAVKEGRDNTTSAKDLGNCFKKIYQHQCIGGNYDDQIIQLLLQEKDKDGLPNVLSETHKIAHKTGGLDALYYDGGIVYTPAGDYIICIMTDNQASHTKALRTMQQIAVLVDNAIG